MRKLPGDINADPFSTLEGSLLRRIALVAKSLSPPTSPSCRTLVYDLRPSANATGGRIG